MVKGYARTMEQPLESVAVSFSPEKLVGSGEVRGADEVRKLEDTRPTRRKSRAINEI